MSEHLTSAVSFCRAVIRYFSDPYASEPARALILVGIAFLIALYLTFGPIRGPK